MQIFVSHSSADDEAVTLLSDWLYDQGFTGHFVDHLHVPGGSFWERKIPGGISSSQILIAYITNSWLTSDECYAEYRTSFYAEKGILLLLVESELAELDEKAQERLHSIRTSNIQIVILPEFPTRAEKMGLLKLSIDYLIERFSRKLLIKRIKRSIAYSASIVILLSALAWYFRAPLTEHLIVLEIENSFDLQSTEGLVDLGKKAADLLPKDRTFRECIDTQFCPNMIVLPAGTFLMGASDDFEPEETELPRSKVSVKPFAVSVTEITQAQWSKCVISTRFSEDIRCKEVPIWSKSSSYPVDSLSWHDAKAYVAWLNQQVSGTPNGPYRLLSETEWEYSARGVTSSSQSHPIYHWGDDIRNACKYANVRNKKMPENIGGSRLGLDCEDNPLLVAAVKSFKPNGFGLFDMTGNLSEWVEDCWHESYDAKPEGQDAWIRSAEIDCSRVIRGGSWVGDLDNLRAAARTKLDAKLFGFNIGFRVARDLDWVLER